MEKIKTKNIKHKLWIVITCSVVLIMIIGSALLGYVEGKNSKKDNSHYPKFNENIQLPESVYKSIIDNYYRDITEEDLKKMNINASNGMLLALDPYSMIMESSSFSGISSELLQIKKIGLYIKTNQYGKYIITGFFNDTYVDATFIEEMNGVPLLDGEKKLKRGDMLHSVSLSGKQTILEGLSQKQYIKIIDNLPDTFELIVERYETLTKSKYLKFGVNKKVYDDIIKNPTLSMVDDNTAIITLESFSNVAIFNQFREDIATVKNNKSIKHLILDLRNNPGGDLKILQQVVMLLLGDLKNMPFMQLKNKRRDNVPINIASSTKVASSHVILEVKSEEALIPNRDDIKFLALANENTASAAEALIGILQNNLYSNFQFLGVVGRKTYGKGVAQTQIDLKNGYILHLTTNEYYVCGNKGWENINGIGYLPYVDNVTGLTEEEAIQLSNIPISYESELCMENIKDDYIVKNALIILKK